MPKKMPVFWWAMWLLRLSSALLCCAVVPLFFPRSLMDQIHRALGLGSIPSQPIFEYLARSISALYFAHGVIVAAISTDVRRYWPLVGILGGLNIFLGVVLLVIDTQVGLPWFWTWLEGPPLTVFGIALVALYMQARTPEHSTH